MKKTPEQRAKELLLSTVLASHGITELKPGDEIPVALLFRTIDFLQNKVETLEAGK
jgi:hypothetical protein